MVIYYQLGRSLAGRREIVPQMKPVAGEIEGRG